MEITKNFSQLLEEFKSESGENFGKAELSAELLKIKDQINQISFFQPSSSTPKNRYLSLYHIFYSI